MESEKPTCQVPRVCVVVLFSIFSFIIACLCLLFIVHCVLCIVYCLLLADYSETEKLRRTGDFLTHMKSVGSSVTGQSLQKQSMKSIEVVVRFVWLVIKMAARIVGIPL
jgi:hypothetical protein